MDKNLEITKPRYSEHSFAGSSASRMSRFPLCFVKKNTLLPFSNTSTKIFIFLFSQTANDFLLG